LTGEHSGLVVVDTSAVMAIVKEEAGHPAVQAVLAGADQRVMSAATGVELGIVILRRTDGRLRGETILRGLGIEIVPVDATLGERAVTAYDRFGKGRHPAALNFGDCFSFALAEILGAPLVCVGHDFALTGVGVLPAQN